MISRLSSRYIFLKKIIFLLLLGVVRMNAEPFSFQEINSIPDFALLQPHFLSASDGVQLAYYSFLPNKNVDHIVLLYPGAGLYANKIYQWVAKTLQEKYAIGCYIFDIRGHGHSQGKRGDAPSIEQVWKDVEQAIDFIKSKNSDAKIYLAGHSSGAGLIINYAAHATKKIEDGYIFLAPFLGPLSQTAYVHKDVEKNFVKKVRIWAYILGSWFPNSFCAHFKAVFFNYPTALLKADPLILSFHTYTMSCATNPYKIEELLLHIDKPVSIFIEEQDEQFIPDKVVLCANLINAPVDAQIIKDAKHLSILLEAPALIDAWIKSQKL